MPMAAGMSRRRSPSATLYCRDRYSTRACAVVRRRVAARAAGLPVMSFSLMCNESRGTRPEPEAQRWGVTRADRADDGLLLRHLRHGCPEALLADAEGLEAAVGHQVRAPERGPVDVDDAGVYLADRLHGARDVLGEDPGTQPVGGGVRLGDRGLPVLRGRDRDRGTEQLVLVEGGITLDTVDDGGRDHGTVPLAAGEQASATVHG